MKVIPMRFPTLPILAALALAGCASQSAPSIGTAGTTPPPVATTTPAQAPLASLDTFTQNDLANAIAIAQKAGAAGAPIVQCFSWVSNQLVNLQGALQPVTGTVGIATTFTVAYLGLNTASGLTSPATKLAYATACGPLNMLVVNQGLTISAQVAALAAALVK
jgi:hypothetical protein